MKLLVIRNYNWACCEREEGGQVPPAPQIGLASTPLPPEKGSAPPDFFGYTEHYLVILCKIKSLSWRYKLFKILFLTIFIPTKTLYDKKWNICVRFFKSLNFSNLENFGDSWGENDASWNVDHGDLCCLKLCFWQFSFWS